MKKEPFFTIKEKRFYLRLFVIVISIILISSHLKHGFQSALKTFGILEESGWGILYKLSIIFWGMIPALFILIIFAIQLNYIQ